MAVKLTVKNFECLMFKHSSFILCMDCKMKKRAIDCAIKLPTQNLSKLSIHLRGFDHPNSVYSINLKNFYISGSPFGHFYSVLLEVSNRYWDEKRLKYSSHCSTFYTCILYGVSSYNFSKHLRFTSDLISKINIKHLRITYPVSKIISCLKPNNI